MLFSSLEFLYLYLPLTVLVYWITPLRWRNAVLLMLSLVFYGWGEPIYLLLMVVTIVIDYGAGLMIARAGNNRAVARRYLVAAIVINVGLLAVFKYADFMLDTLRRFSPFAALPRLSLPLPIGISFYTFQALSYVIDVYRGEVEAQRDAVAFGTYVTLFPQLVAGPIVRYQDVAEQLRTREQSAFLVSAGTRTFICGLCKKVLLANPIGALWESLRDLPTEQLTTLGAWLGIVCFTLQIYFDFSGYSDMAVGLGRMLGFHFPENFNYPLCAQSITDFWRRWHMTLSSWFREYVYIPLGGNRNGRWRTYRNLLVVWALTGLWHGASWNFVLWGLYFFVLLVVEKAFLGRVLERAPRLLRHGYTCLLVVFSFAIFVFDGSISTLDAAAASSYLGVMLGIGGRGWTDGVLRYELIRHLPLLAILLVGLTPLPRRLYHALCARHRWMDGVSTALCTAGLLICTAYLLDGAYNPFLYFRF